MIFLSALFSSVSWRARLCHIAAAGCVIIGGANFIENVNAKTFFLFLFLLILGIALFVLALNLNSKDILKKLEEAKNDPALIDEIRRSAVAAHKLYNKLPCEETLEFIEMHNSFAARKIKDASSKIITEKQAEEDMASYDYAANNGYRYESPEYQEMIAEKRVELEKLEAAEKKTDRITDLKNSINNRRKGVIIFSAVFALGTLIIVVMGIINIVSIISLYQAGHGFKFAVDADNYVFGILHQIAGVIGFIPSFLLYRKWKKELQALTENEKQGEASQECDQDKQ